MKQTIKNYALFLVGLFIASMGVALSTKAGLGTSPVAAVPYSVSIVNHALTFGWWLNIWSLLQVAVQVFCFAGNANRSKLSFKQFWRLSTVI